MLHLPMCYICARRLYSFSVHLGGWISKKDNQLRLNIKRKDGGVTRGRKCETLKIPVLLECFQRLEYLPKADAKYKDMKRESLVNSIQNLDLYGKIRDEGVKFKELYELTASMC